MEYIIKIEDTKKAKSLLTFLRSLNFITVIKSDVKKHNTNKSIEKEEFATIIKTAENSRSIPLVDAIEMSSNWKNKKR